MSAWPKQRGGSFKVNGWIAMLAVAVAALGATTSAYLFKHQQIIIRISPVISADKTGHNLSSTD
jgi:hypothetical protein